jgi:hypothetical protein
MDIAGKIVLLTGASEGALAIRTEAAEVYAESLKSRA